jgi:hypothetical protein
MAQIITLNSGYHNNDLVAASARLTEQGSWKKQRIVYIVPTGDKLMADPGLREFEYVFTIEHDNIPPLGTEVLRLLKAMETHPEYAAISGLYWTKGEGGVPQIWGDIKDPVQNYRPQIPVPGQVIECYGLGMGFALYRMSMFRELDAKKVPRPWFKTVGKDPEDKGVGTQDLYFYGNIARPNGFRCAVDCDTTIGHIADDGRIW